MYFKAISVALFYTVISFGMTSIAHADETLDAVPIEEGEPAPFSGTLLTDEAAATLLSKIRTCEERAVSDIQLEFDTYTARCELDKSLLQINLDSQQQRFENIIQMQDDQLEYLLRSNQRSGISREVSFIIGAVSGIALTTVAAYALNSAVSN